MDPSCKQYQLLLIVATYILWNCLVSIYKKIKSKNVFCSAHIILIEHSEHERGELARVSVWEELRVDFDEASLREQPVRTILQESFVPKIKYQILLRQTLYEPNAVCWPIRPTGCHFF